MRLYILATLLSTTLLAHPLYFERESSTEYHARLTTQTLVFHPDALKIGVITLHFLNASPFSTLAGLGTPAPATYIQASATRTLLQYPKLALQRVYSGIDVIFYGAGDHLEYDLVVSPGADLRRIRMSFDGAGNIRTDAGGNLRITSARESFTQMLPRVFQSDGRRIQASYVLLSNRQIAFRIGRYNPRLPLTIDPELVFTKYFGGSATDTPRAIATDADSNIYIAGNTNSTDFPTTSGFQTKSQPPLIAISGTGGAVISHLPVGNESSILAVGGTSDGSVLYAFSPNATYVSSNQGATWTQNAPLRVSISTSPIPPPSQLQINSISVDAIDPARVFVATNQGLFFTSQGGQSWSLYDYQLPAGPTGPPNVSWVAISPTDHLTTYVTTTLPPAVYKTNNAGVTWTSVAPAPPSTTTPAFYSYAATLAPNGNDLFVIDPTGTLYRSTDGAVTWQPLSSQHFNAVSIVIDPNNASNIYLLDYAGLEQSTDGGITFTKLFGLASPIGAINRIAIDSSSETLYFSSTGANSIGYIPAAGGAPQYLTVSTPDLHALTAVGGQVYAAFDTPTIAFVTKWDPSGTNLLFSTFCGGTRQDSLTAMALDAQGNPTLAGSTYSPDFPITTKIGGPPTSSTAPVAFVSRLSADGTHLIYSLFLGGAANTFVNSTTIQALAVDSAGAAYVTGNTGATDFPITPGAFQSARPQSTCNRPQANILVITSLPGDAFVTKISPDGSQLQYSTRVTGSCGSVGQSIAVDPSGEAVLAGYTPSSDLPVSTGSYQSTFPGDPSQINPPNALTVGFAAKLSAAGDRLLAGTYLGGSYSSQASAVTLDPTGNIYLSGQSGKLVPGATPGAYQAKVTDTCAYPISIGPSLPYGGANDAFILKLDPTLSTAAFMTYLGGGCNDAGSSIALDSARNIWLLGNSQSVDFPLKSPFQSGNASSQFLSELSADGSQLLFSTVTDGIAFAIDRSGAVNLVGPGVTSTIPKNAQAIGPIGASIEWVRINPATSPSVVIDGIAPVTAFLPTVLAPYYPGKSIVPGELIQITGRNLGPPTQINGQLDATGRMPFSLAGITVLFDNIPAPLVSVSATSITCFAPFEIRSSTNLTVQSNARKSNTVRVGVLPSDMQILSVNNQDGTPNSAANPAHAGDIVVFYASGLGLTSPLSADGLINAPPLAVPALPVMVYLPRLTSPPDFVGAAPGQIAGIMQINVRLPATAPPANPLSIGFNTTSAPVYVQ